MKTQPNDRALATSAAGPRLTSSADPTRADTVTHTTQSTPIDRASPIYVAGHNGLVGGAVCRELVRAGFQSVVGRTSKELDLRSRKAVFKYFRAVHPRYVVLAAARVGGIGANAALPVDFVSDNLQIQVNVLDAALAFDVERLLFLGSSCIYPRHAPQPLTEDSLMTGALEPTNEPYAIAKIAGLVHVQAMRRQYGRRWISVMPTNLYGPRDNFSTSSSHVLPALIRRYQDAVDHGDSVVTNWGTGHPRREFLHVADLARACIFLLDHYDDARPINVGTGRDMPVMELAELVSELVGYRGATEWDTALPDGTPRKVLDVTRITKAGWRPEIGLREGVAATIDWYRDHRGTLPED